MYQDINSFQNSRDCWAGRDNGKFQPTWYCCKCCNPAKGRVDFEDVFQLNIADPSTNSYNTDIKQLRLWELCTCGFVLRFVSHCWSRILTFKDLCRFVDHKSRFVLNRGLRIQPIFKRFDESIKSNKSLVA
jgi:hypothetical protein